jgi:hypothetical protein
VLIVSRWPAPARLLRSRGGCVKLWRMTAPKDPVAKIVFPGDQASAHAVSEAWRRSMQEKAVDLSKEGLKTVILLNGAGAGGMLALVGQAVERNAHLVSLLTIPLGLFAIGAFVGGLATVGAYLTQYAIGESVSRPKFGTFAKYAHPVTMLFVLASYVLFAVAAWLAYAALRNPVPTHALPT